MGYNVELFPLAETMAESDSRPVGAPKLDLLTRIGRSSWARYIFAGLMAAVAALLFIDREVVPGILFLALALAAGMVGWRISRASQRVAGMPCCRSCGAPLASGATECPRCGLLQ